MTDTTVTGLNELMNYAGRLRGGCAGPLLLIVGTVSRSVDVDGTVIERIGQVAGQPAYEVVPRAYRITPDGGVEITDDAPDWFDAGNSETELIAPGDATLVVVVEPATHSLRTPPEAGNVVVYPPASDE